MTRKIIREVSRTGIGYIEALYGTLEAYLEESWDLSPHGGFEDGGLAS